jgi:hypothetical protein
MASLKQAVYVPFDFVSLGTQLQLFAAVASSIIVGAKNVCTNPSDNFYTTSDKAKRASAMRLHLANSLPQDSFLKLTGESKGGFECVSKQQF